MDISKDGGLGDVVLKNIQLYTPTTEKLSAVHHANGEDIWVITHQWESDAFYVYHISKNGLNEDPVISRTGSIHEFGSSNRNTIGEMKSSQSGKLLSLNIADHRKTEIFYFDAITGYLSMKDGFITPAIYDGDVDGNIYGVAFSPNEKYLYLSENFPSTFPGQKIYQYSLRSKRLSEIDTVHIGGSIQLGPDQKVYVADKDRQELMVIERPNLPLNSPLFSTSRISLAPGYSRFSLPNFIQSYFYVPDPVVRLPNAFTPNNDGRNELFEPLRFSHVETFEMSILDRTGTEIFSTSKADVWWKGNEREPGVYYWNLQYEGINGKSGLLKGWVQLSR